MATQHPSSILKAWQRKWKGYYVNISMKSIIDSMLLNKEKIKLVQDY
ncbi:MAG: hypothetical protein ACR2FN_09315 [Chitinophagaceae bacterium]